MSGPTGQAELRWDERTHHAVLGRCIEAPSVEDAVRQALASEIAGRHGWAVESVEFTTRTRFVARFTTPSGPVRWPPFSVLSGSSAGELGFAS